ncbi:BamA/TamA family outer membrane protein [Muriicola sp. Z0-33]|uniref:BamA/TamA family outer membrane protein n=1 Tax=Muriicola sp. Z0-33 TaxID=2816957 RepID=UPI002237D45A|nr:BamA/TamA family outer membrane protein [Muriicola sp. Z0-33]MCW5515066.1 metallophosphoesterase [Muriicola sp. Z0-33]
MTKHYVLILIVLLASGCASYKAQYSEQGSDKDIISPQEVAHTFYLIGDAGLSPEGGLNPALKNFKSQLSKADQNSTAIFLGDNIYPAGLPKKSDEGYMAAKHNLDAQISVLEDFNGNAFFIPGNHDWYNDGLKGLKRQQKYIEEQLQSKKVFYPENGCPIEDIKISDKIVVIAIDTKWYLADWDKHPNINDDCEIKSRTKFFEEIESLIKKNRDKTTLIALHHPMFTYGSHGGQFSFKKSLSPIPVLGTFINMLRRTTGASPEDLQNKRYRDLKKRLVTLAQYSDRVILASGHEHTLQYIVEDNTPQIVSGSGAKKGAARLLNGSKFATGQMGYATLEVYKDGASRVRYFGTSETSGGKFLFTSEVLPPYREVKTTMQTRDFPPEVKASVYTKEETDKTNFFKSIWGERYRELYSREVTAPTVRLDTLFGGLRPVRKGGGHQSKSLRLEHKSGRQYVMRALKKSAELYLQAMAFQDQYIVGDFEDTYTEDLLSDFYTGSHPYAPFTIGKLSDAVDIFHTNPVLYYIPKQPALEEYNKDFGDELYMIEEHTSEGHDIESFGYTKAIESTDDLIKNLREDEKYQVDKAAYIRARLFDMMIGDWDRHVDQWRWAEFKDEDSGKVIYKPIPRDRDQAFSIMGDGALMNLATRIVPGLRLMEGFTEEIRSVRGFNSSPKTYVLDMAILPETHLELWEEQARFIQENITEEVIDDAFKAFPKEVHDETVVKIKKILLARKHHLMATAKEYYRVINKYGVVIGTDKDDYFTIKGLSPEQTEVIGQRIKGGEKAEIFFKKTYDKNITKEIWIYGLDDDDVFESSGKTAIKVRLIGGQNNDTYKIATRSGIQIYEHRNKNNNFEEAAKARIHKTNDYNTNTYLFSKLKSSFNQIIPTIGSNPDDGFKIGLTNIYTFNGFKQNPFTQQHTLNAAFYFATSGFDLGYKGEFAQVLGKANLELDAKFTSPNFSINFFGFGNETVNLDDDLDLDYNRVKIQTLRLAPSLVWRGDLGSKFRLGMSYETIEVEETEDRFINTFYQANGAETNNDFFGVDGQYTYSNVDNAAFPTMGMATSLHAGYTTNLDNSDQSFSYIIPSLSMAYKLASNGRWVVATKLKAHFNIGDDFEFYQAASIGGTNGLRGFRNQRFAGKKAFYQNTDLRLSITDFKTGLLPVGIGLYGGFDYGRVWLPEDDSNIWHTSVGGGFFVNGADIISANMALFNSDDGLRFTFGLGFGF